MPDSFRTAYYDREAASYDESRGGAARASAAAEAVVRLLPSRLGTCVDVAGGTGSVAAALAARGLDVVVADLSEGMLRLAAVRLPGRVLRADARALPLADASVDVVTTVWLLHLIGTRAADAVAAEAARVLRPGGHWVTSVDKPAAHDASAVPDADASARVTALAQRLGLDPAGTTSFHGTTRWTSASDTPDQLFHLASFQRRP